VTMLITLHLLAVNVFELHTMMLKCTKCKRDPT